MSRNELSASPSPDGERGPVPPLRILIAEDDRDTAASLEALLQDEGHSTRCVYRGREVVYAVKEFGADVVLLDIGMPGINGYDIARVLRKTFGTRKPTIVAVTAWNRVPDMLMAKAAGFDRHFGKPYDPKQLLAYLAQVATDKAK